jgi:hypothetical protein
VELVEIDGPVVYLRLQGACGSCPSSLTTMTMGIKRRLQEKIPVCSQHNCPHHNLVVCTMLLSYCPSATFITLLHDCFEPQKVDSLKAGNFQDTTSGDC